MAQDRVDKRWQEQGLAAYSTEAILGTLAHYGKALDEAGFRQMAQAQYPMQMASAWLEAWKGTGQFKQFPFVAFSELWRRLEKDRLAPAEVAQPLIQLMMAVDEGPDAVKATEALGALEAMRPRIPTEGDGAQERFVAEVVAHFSEEAWEAFNQLGEALARAGRAEDAQRFAALEAFLIPERQGISAALVEAAAGKRTEAVAALEAIAKDGSATPERRMSAVDALLHLDAKDETLAHGLPLLEDAEKREDFHLGIGIASTLVELLREKGDRARTKEMEARLEKLVEAHHRAHPHHH